MFPNLGGVPHQVGKKRASFGLLGNLSVGEERITHQLRQVALQTTSGSSRLKDRTQFWPSLVIPHSA